MGVSIFVVLCLWDLIASGLIELLELLGNAVAAIVFAFASVVADKRFLKEADRA